MATPDNYSRNFKTIKHPSFSPRAVVSQIPGDGGARSVKNHHRDSGVHGDLQNTQTQQHTSNVHPLRISDLFFDLLEYVVVGARRGDGAEEKKRWTRERTTVDGC